MQKQIQIAALRYTYTVHIINPVWITVFQYYQITKYIVKNPQISISCSQAGAKITFQIYLITCFSAHDYHLYSVT